MYFQEIHLFLLYYLTHTNLVMGSSAASLARSMFKGKFQDSPESLKSYPGADHVQVHLCLGT